MLSSQTQEFSPVEEEPDDSARLHVVHGDVPRELTPREREIRGIDAYEQATERQASHGLDAETVALYGQASSDLLGAVFLRPGEQAPNPWNEVKIARSLAMQAEAMEHRFYDDPASSHIDEKSNLQEIAAKTLRHGVIGLINRSGQDAEVSAAEASPAATTEIVAEAVVEAAQEAGTDEHVVIRGIGEVDEETPQRLEAGGTKALGLFIVEHAMQPGIGNEFIKETVENIEEEKEEITGVHDRALAA